jgi:hypothetical protein
MDTFTSWNSRYWEMTSWPASLAQSSADFPSSEVSPTLAPFSIRVGAAPGAYLFPFIRTTGLLWCLVKHIETEKGGKRCIFGDEMKTMAGMMPIKGYVWSIQHFYEGSTSQLEE